MDSGKLISDASCGAILIWSETPEDGSGTIIIPDGFIRTINSGDNPTATPRRFCLRGSEDPTWNADYHSTIHGVGQAGVWTLGAIDINYKFHSITFAHINGTVVGTLRIGAKYWDLTGTPTSVDVILSSDPIPNCATSSPNEMQATVEEAETQDACLLNPLDDGPGECLLLPGDFGGSVALAGPAAGPGSASAYGYRDVLDIAILTDIGAIGSPFGFVNINEFRGRSVNAITNMQMAFDNSYIDTYIRLVVADTMNLPQNLAFDTNGDGILSHGEWLQLLQNNGPLAAIRNFFGADVVVGVVPSNTPGGSGLSGGPENPTANAAAGNAGAFVTSGPSLEGIVHHELGHQLGIEHAYWAANPGNADCDRPNGRLVEGCGYVFPNNRFWECPTACTPGSTPMPWPCTDVPDFQDLMSKQTTHDRPNFYSDPCIIFTQPNGRNGQTGDCDDTTGTTFAGTRVQDAPSAMMADGAHTIRSHLPTVESYRAEVSIVRGAELVSPPAGSTVAPGPVLVTWNDVGSNQTIVEVGPPGAAPTSTATAGFGVTQATLTVPAGFPVIKVRIITDVPMPSGATRPATWEYRWNNDNVVMGCNQDSADVVPIGLDAVPTADCQDIFLGGQVHNYCSWNGATGVFSCDLDGPGTGGGSLNLVSGVLRPSRPWDLLAWGRGENGQDFCCLFADPNDRVRFVDVRGTSGGDIIRLASGPYTLDDFHLAGVQTKVQALGGADEVFGAESMASGYGEFLNGQRGGDRIRGGRGDDHIDGGREADQLFGECGNDTVRAKETDFADTLHGGFGNDDVCSVSTIHVMVSSDLEWSDDIDHMFYSTGGGAPPPASEFRSMFGDCGHQSYGPWGINAFSHPLFGVQTCPSTTLTATPSECAAVWP
jgi:hypothetical protein